MSQLGIPSYAALAANMAVTTNTVLADVSGLTAPIAAGQKMYVRFFLPFSVAGTAPGAKFRVVAPAAPTAYVESRLMFDMVTSPAVVFEASTVVALTDFGATLNVTGSHLAEIQCTIVASVAGDVKLQFAQNVSDAAASTLLAGAYMEIVALS